MIQEAPKPEASPTNKKDGAIVNKPAHALANSHIGYVRDIDLSTFATGWLGREVVERAHKWGDGEIRVSGLEASQCDIHVSIKEKRGKRALYYDLTLVMRWSGKSKLGRGKDSYGTMEGILKMYNIGQDTKFELGGDKETSYMYELGMAPQYHGACDPWIARAVTCSVAVTKPIGLKQPEIHTDGGSVSMGLEGADHSSSCAQRSCRSANHAESDLRLYVPVGPIWPHVLSQMGGTWFMKIDVMSASIESEMLSAPDRPSASSLSCVRICAEDLVHALELLQHEDDVRRALVLDAQLRISIMLKSSRSCSRMATCTSDTFSSLDWPPPPPPPPPPTDERIGEEVLAERVEQRDLGVGVHAEEQRRLGRRGAPRCSCGSPRTRPRAAA